MEGDDDAFARYFSDSESEGGFEGGGVTAGGPTKEKDKTKDGDF